MFHFKLFFVLKVVLLRALCSRLAENRCVFSALINCGQLIDGERRCGGTKFQMEEPENVKLVCWLNVEVPVRGTMKSPRMAKRRLVGLGMLETAMKVLQKYAIPQIE